MIVSLGIKEEDGTRVVYSRFPNIEAEAAFDDVNQATQEVKGAVLCCIGQWDTVPNLVEFVVETPEEYSKRIHGLTG